MRILLTRPEPDSHAFAAGLPKGIETLIWPLSQIVFYDTPDLSGLGPETQGIIATSRHGVHALARHSARRDLVIFCVGTATGQAARAAGFGDIRIAPGGDAESLCACIMQSGMRRLFYARGEKVSRDIADILAKCGLVVTQSVFYRAEPGAAPSGTVLAALKAGAVDLITIWSQENARRLQHYVDGFSGIPWRGCDILAISHNACIPLAQTDFRRIFVADHPNADAMRAVIITYKGGMWH